LGREGGLSWREVWAKKAASPSKTGDILPHTLKKNLGAQPLLVEMPKLLVQAEAEMVRLGSNPDESGSADGQQRRPWLARLRILRLFFKGIREPFGVALFWLPFLVTAQKVVVKRLSFDSRPVGIASPHLAPFA
jgi:hypothetical protein